MMGTATSPGLVRSTGDFIFDFLERSHRARGTRGTVTVSCLEIYNEAIRDILAPFMASGGPLVENDPTRYTDPASGGQGNRSSIVEAAEKIAKAVGLKGSSLRIR